MIICIIMGSIKNNWSSKCDMFTKHTVKLGIRVIEYQNSKKPSCMEFDLQAFVMLTQFTGVVLLFNGAIT